MKNSDGRRTDVSDKTRRKSFREVSSRYLPSTPIENGSIASPDPTLSPLWQKPKSKSSSGDPRKHRSHDSSFMSKLWPSATTKSTSPTKNNGTLAQHLGDEREKDLVERRNSDQKSEKLSFLNRQRSYSIFSRFESDQKFNSNGIITSSSKENHKPFFGGSMRYTGKFKIPGRSSGSSSSNSSTVVDDDQMIPGRLSIDERALRQRSFRGRSDFLSENVDSGSECSDLGSNTSLGSPFVGRNPPASYMSPTVSSSYRKSGIEVPSKYMNERLRRGTSDLNITAPIDKSPKKKLNIKRANSLTTALKVAVSPGRPESQPVESKGGSVPHSNLKPPTSPSKGKFPPTSPSRTKGLGGFLSLGLDLFKTKKPYPSSNGSGGAVALGLSTAESVHQLRMIQNRLLQWRYANARSEIVNWNIATQTESNLLSASDALIKLQQTVLQKKLQLAKEKLEMKLNHILRSQIKPLGSWSDMERQHLLAVSETTEALHSVVCRVPLIEGAVVEPESASFALRFASDLAVSLNSMLSTFSPEAEKTVSVLAELAEVAAQEKSMLEECLELSEFISKLEMEERSLKCNIIQLKLQHQEREIACS